MPQAALKLSPSRPPMQNGQRRAVLPGQPFLLLPVIGAVIEELIFRWLLLGKWLLREKRIKPIAAILVVGMVFSLMHLWNLRSGTAFSDVAVQMIFAFCFSVWAEADVLRTGRVVLLLAHLLLNATATAAPGCARVTPLARMVSLESLA